jgi:predicted phosphodiesterase
MRLFAVSDVHVDFPPNMEWLLALEPARYFGDAIIVAGDVTDDLRSLERVFRHLTTAFQRVFFVPGNHELWVRREECRDSLEKFEAVLSLCRTFRVGTQPEVLRGAASGVWVVPLFSWYVEPHEGEASLFVAKPGEDPSLEQWSDKYFVRWPQSWKEGTAADRFLAINEPFVSRTYDAPVVSFSHVLPRRELIFGSWRDQARRTDPHPEFNFSRVAGCASLDRQIRRLGSQVHVYGHQHRNRDVTIETVRYVSNCRGYPRERELGFLPANGDGLKLVWHSETGFAASGHDERG